MISLFLRSAQEKPNDIPEGETPHAVVLHVYEANVDVCRYKLQRFKFAGLHTVILRAPPNL